MIHVDREDLWKKAGIYQIINNVNTKVYVGSSLNLYERLITHFSQLRKNVHSNIYLQRSWNKYREESFKYKIIEFCNSEVLLEKEQHYIDTETLFCSRDKAFNINTKATSGTFSNETRIKISDTLKRKGIFPPSRKGIKYRGKPHTEETKRKISLKLIGTKIKPETIKKIRQTKIDHNSNKHSEETKLKMSIIAKEQKRVPPAPKKKVNQITLEGKLIKQFNSLKEAARSLGKRDNGGSDICAVCKGRQKQAFGYKWEYANEKNI
jgi:group I intron endonuclease